MIFLKKFLSILTAALSFGQVAFASEMIQYDIVIVGGGLSGLNCARTICQGNPNAHIAIIEGRDRLGGRTNTLTTHDNKLIEAGGELIDRDQKFIQGVLDELGLEKDPVRLDGEIFAINEIGKLALADIVPHLNSMLDKFSTVSASLKNEDYSTWDNKLNRWVSTSLCSYFAFSDIEKSLLQPIIRDECGIDLDLIPLSSIGYPTKKEWEKGWLTEKLESYQKIALAKSNSFISLFSNAVLSFYDHQYRIHGGTKALVQALAKKVPEESIFNNTCLTRLSRQHDRYKLEMMDGRVFVANKVVLSTPFSVLRSQYGILDDESLGISSGLRQVIDTMTYGTNSKLIVPTQSHTSTSYVINMNHGGVTAWQNPGGITWFLGGTQGANLTENSDIVPDLKNQMPKMFNATLNDKSKPIIVNWSLDPFSRGSYRTTSVTQPTSHLYGASSVLPELCAFATPLNNNSLFFIGEHTCSGTLEIPENGDETISTGYMQSALFSGHVVGKFISSLK